MIGKMAARGAYREAAAPRLFFSTPVIPAVELGLLVIFAGLPLVLKDFWVVFITRVLILTLLALSFDLVWGFAGIMSFGQALFFGASGYGVALLARDLGIRTIFVVLPSALLIGLLLSALIAGFVLLGRYPPSVIFVALGTLTGSYAGDRLARGWYYLGGQNGIPSIPPLTVGRYELGEGMVFYYLALGVVIGVYLVCRFLVRSQFGLALTGIRINEARMTFFGYRVQILKAIVFCVAGAIAGLAGGLYAYHEGFVWPNMLGVIFSTQIVLYALFGGVGTLVGAAVGVVVIEIATFVLADHYPTIWPIILGLLLLLVIVFRPGGLISLVVSERERIGAFGGPVQRRAVRGETVGGTA